MASGPITSWQIEGGKVEAVTDFIFLGSRIPMDSDCSHEIKRHLLLGRKAMIDLDSVLKIKRMASRGVRPLRADNDCPAQTQCSMVSLVHHELRRCSHTATWEWRPVTQKQKAGSNTSKFCILSTRWRRCLSFKPRARGQNKVQSFLQQLTWIEVALHEQQMVDLPPHVTTGIKDPVSSQFSEG